MQRVGTRSAAWQQLLRQSLRRRLTGCLAQSSVSLLLPRRACWHISASLTHAPLRSMLLTSKTESHHSVALSRFLPIPFTSRFCGSANGFFNPFPSFPSSGTPCPCQPCLSRYALELKLEERADPRGLFPPSDPDADSSLFPSNSRRLRFARCSAIADRRRSARKDRSTIADAMLLSQMVHSFQNFLACGAVTECPGGG